MSYLPYDPGGLEPPRPLDWCEHSENWGASAAPQGPELTLPSPEQLEAWLRAIVQRDGLDTVLKALFKTVSKERVMEATERICNEHWGDEPLHETDSGTVRCMPAPHQVLCCPDRLCPAVLRRMHRYGGRVGELRLRARRLRRLTQRCSIR